MAKEKVIEETTKVLKNNGNMLMQSLPLLLGLVCLLVCYFLYKKIQTLSFQSETINKIDKQLNKMFEEQNEINNIHSKQFQGIVNQINYLNHIINNKHNINNKENSTDEIKENDEKPHVLFNEDTVNSKHEKKNKKMSSKKVISLETSKEAIIEEDTSSEED